MEYVICPGILMEYMPCEMMEANVVPVFKSVKQTNPNNRVLRLPQKFIHPMFFVYLSKVCIIVQPIAIFVQ